MAIMGVWGDIRALGGGVTRGGVWGDIMKVGGEIDGLGWISLLLVLGFWEMGEILGRLSVRVELDKRGVDLDSVICPSYNNVVETYAHCLVTCDLDMSVWDNIFNWWKILEYSFQQGSSFECHVPSDIGQFLLFELWSTVVTSSFIAVIPKIPDANTWLSRRSMRRWKVGKQVKKSAVPVAVMDLVQDVNLVPVASFEMVLGELGDFPCCFCRNDAR
ncbi:hypothetical protein Tco_0343176 [Tanacetum coccineum]